MKKTLLELEKNIFQLKRYYDFDDIEYEGIRDMGYLFDLSIDEDYYKPMITNEAFNSNYIKYESKGDKDKTLFGEYLDIIWPYLSEIINNH